MSKSVVYVSGTGNTELLAKTIAHELGEDVYCGKPSEEALEADTIFVGFWAQAFSCPPVIKDVLEKLKNKKVFIFATAGYGSTPEFFNPIMDSAVAHLDSSNTVIGTYICQGKVSEKKQEAIKQMDATKYENMKAELDNSLSHPDADDLDKLRKAIVL
ncbi:MAG: hypothetical protein BEN18_04665 [Epulopiscium sp. Nuni2H_MBin001]|nr:MAG: hypothetical protein BEN18_04665 [Epulopiscium sp. Nuni2H_MBin001]